MLQINTEYPINDDQFEETMVDAAEKESDGWSLKRTDGWSFFVPGDSPIVPEKGMVARFYGKGIGFPVRGLFLNGTKIFYRTEIDDEGKQEIDMYGIDANDWLRRWDEGQSVWSISMGGLGPGYEQCIHITAAEILRFMLDKKYDPSFWEDKEIWKQDLDQIEKMSFANPVIMNLGLSGAQWGAAVNLAAMFYRQGPRVVMNDKRVKDRHIQVSKNFPG